MSDQPTPGTEATGFVAIVIDGKVMDVMGTTDRLHALLTSSPTIVNLGSDAQKATSLVPEQCTYDEVTRTFTNPDGSTFVAPE
jgi:endo-1,4-beta-mannosidase